MQIQGQWQAQKDGAVKRKLRSSSRDGQFCGGDRGSRESYYWMRDLEPGEMSSEISISEELSGSKINKAKSSLFLASKYLSSCYV
jgi:hypothetical protein